MKDDKRDYVITVNNKECTLGSESIFSTFDDALIRAKKIQKEWDKRAIITINEHDDCFNPQVAVL